LSGGTTEPCPRCGLQVGGEAACRALLDELMARAVSDPRFARAYRVAVEAYAMQHVETFGASGKSYAAHLTGLACMVESDGDPAMLAAIRRWLDGVVPIEKPLPIPSRGRLTILDARRAEEPDAHAAVVRAWAADVWNAYREQHALAHRWLAEAARAPVPRH